MIYKYAMGLFPVDCLQSTRENYNLTTKLISLRNHRNYYLPYFLSKIKTLSLNLLRGQSPVVLKACSVLQVLLIKYSYHNRGFSINME